MRWLIVAGLLFFSGCGYKNISHGSEITDSQAEAIVNGKTAKSDIYMMLGEPKKILEGGRIFIYNWVKGAKWHLLWVGAGTAYGKSFVVSFNDMNIVISHNITRGEVGDKSQVLD